MNTMNLNIRGMEIGAGMPKICVPIVAETTEDILVQTKRIIEKEPDLLELRIDWFSGVKNWDLVHQLLKELRKLIENRVLLFTLRTCKEGGKAEISVEDYKRLGRQACESGLIDLIDVEGFLADGLLAEMAETAHHFGVYVVGSNHDFDKTPKENELVSRLEEMDRQGADICKIAVMPKRERDVLILLSATLSYREAGNAKPVITMSMAEQGMVSRLAGGIFGSAVTFAAVGEVSAPGQMPIEEMRQILEVIHKQHKW